MSRKARRERRSGCPLNASVEMLGDRWSLLIVRDMMLRGHRSFAEFLDSHEGIATNILADRLERLADDEIIAASPDPADGRKKIYRLTAKGIALAPVLAELVLWASAHEKTGQQALVRTMRKNKSEFLSDIRNTWRKHGAYRGHSS
jgi:DNA-binding HxlR family transcriptional regulator